MSDLVVNPEDRFSHNEASTGQPRYSTRRYSTNLDITRYYSGPHFFPKPPFFLFYNMKRSHVEKNLSYRLVNTVEISVNTVVVIIKIGLSRHMVYQKDYQPRSPLIKTIDILIPIKFLSKHCHTFVDYKCPALNKQILIDPHHLTLLISHILHDTRDT